MSKNIKVVELFAGVGGFRYGLEKSSNRFMTIWANQWEPGRKVQYAYDCYVKNFGISHNCINDDISIVRDSIPNDFDILVGGFPCQDYSVARTNAKGITGKKGVLWWDINWVIEKHRPQFVLLENVDRLLKSPAYQRGRDFGIMLRCLFDLGYTVEWRVINAADYGFTQKRRRVFIFASKLSANFSKNIKNDNLVQRIIEYGLFASIFPVRQTNISKSHSCSISKGLFPDLIDFSDNFSFPLMNAGIMYDGMVVTLEINPIIEKPVTIREIREEKPIDKRYFIGDDLSKWKYMKGAKREPRVRPNGEKYFYTEGAIPFPDSLDGPARTMLTSESSTNRSTHIIEDSVSGKLRYLTPIECERINMFPDNWTNTGMPEKFRYFVMGNALVVGVIERLGKKLAEII